MRRNIWILNHYATNTFFDRGGRHYYFSKYLKKADWSPTVFCASTVHGRATSVRIETGSYKIDFVDNIPYVFVKSNSYEGSRFLRILNMLAFTFNLFKVTKQINCEKPDIILASSVHPFTCVAGILIARRYHVPCVVEIRDLWPESIVEYGGFSRKNPVIQVLYMLEQWIYKKADRLIFTIPGGYDYIKERGWQKKIPEEKVFYINNGVDLDEFNYNRECNKLDDPDLLNPDTFKVVYTGSVRSANNVGLLIDAAAILQKQDKKIEILIFGDGTEKPLLEKKIKENRLTNVKLKGHVEKAYVPFILSCSDLNVLIYQRHAIWRFGGSQNKLFDYFASKKPVLSNIQMGYCLIQKYSAGISLNDSAAEQMAGAILGFSNLSADEYATYCENAMLAAEDYSYKQLAEKLENLLEELVSHKREAAVLE